MKENSLTMTSLAAASHNNLLRARAIERLVKSDKFRQAFKAATQEELREAEHLILEAKVTELKQLVTNLAGDNSYRALRKLACSRHISQYSRMTKDELVYANKQWELLNGNSRAGVGRHDESPHRDVTDARTHGSEVERAGSPA